MNSITQYFHFLVSEDTPLSEVKVGELPAWLMRRSKNPIDWTRAAGRAYSRYMQNWVYVRKGGIAPFFHFAAMWCGLFYVMNHKKHYAPHSNAKIHW